MWIQLYERTPRSLSAIKEDFVTKVSILIPVGVNAVIMVKFIVEPYANAMVRSLYAKYIDDTL